jgi:hypothetical protein
MRRSGESPVVKRSKLACETLRRAASGHIEVTQLSKFAAASRIALAVIKGWPEAPSSPLHGNAALLVEPGAAGPGLAGSVAAARFPFEPVKRLPRKFSGPLLGADCARAWPETSKAAATMTAPVCRIADFAASPAMSVPPALPPKSGFQEAPSRFPID